MNTLPPLRIWSLALLVVSLVLGACSPDKLTRQEVYDPASCEECHPTHVEQWGMSMHAYAGDDPVFLAMNRRGQEETNGELGSFCINCHAPLAVQLGEVEDGLELEEDDFPQYFKGVTCAFCHLAAHSEGDSNNPIEIDDRLVIKGPFDDPFQDPAHRAEYSPFMDRNQRESTEICGPCHDIVLDNGVHLEQTYLEWQNTVFADDLTLTTCGNCHMPASSEPGPIADVEGVPARLLHDHSMPGVDVAITPWAGREEYRQMVQAELEDTVRSEICVDSEPPGWRVTVGLENIKAGHSFPSGSSQDRRIWAQIQAFDGDELLWESGVVPEGTPASELLGPDTGIILRDYLKGADGEEVHMFWDVAEPPERDVLNGIRVFGAEEIRVWDFVGPAFTEPDRVSLRLFERPIGLDVLDDLIESGHLDPAFRAEMPTFELVDAALEWTGPVLGTCVQTDSTPGP
ncbi:MAG: hypothetical protein KDA24_08800 [Deltaproteobacteria bacterium]|nr:hypothetical protein [Deltaproteobacteria bacterium]